MPEERDEPISSGNSIDFILFALWAAVIVFAATQL